jgi:hypothetical protein
MEKEDSVKQYPVKILDDLYVFGFIGSSKREKEKFLKLDLLEKIERLSSENPLARKVRVTGTIPEFYTPAFGDFVISHSGYLYIQEQDEEIAKDKSEELFSKLKETHEKMNYFGSQMEKFIYSGKAS